MAVAPKLSLLLFSDSSHVLPEHEVHCAVEKKTAWVLRFMATCWFPTTIFQKVRLFNEDPHVVHELARAI
jgi:hypothetical protein